MKLNKTKNAINNIFWAIINRFFVLLMPFIIRTLIIRVLGVEYLGLSGLFTSILNVLNLAELGVSSAIVFNLYKAIANDDTKLIRELLNIYKKVYRLIGLIVLLIGITIMPFLQGLIKGSYPGEIDIYLLFILYLINTVFSYWMFSYKRALFAAHQRNDIISKVELISRITQYLLQIFILIIYKNIYLYSFISIISTLLNNVLVAIISKRVYPEYYCEGHIDGYMKKDILRRVKGLLVTRVSATTRTTFDSVFISYFIGLSAVAIYNNYYFILNAIHGILIVALTAIKAGIGNSLVTESVDKNYQDMSNIGFMYSWLSGVATICLAALYQHFMIIWVGDSLTLPTLTMFAFPLYFYILTIGDVRYIYHEAAGLWWEGRYRAIGEAAMNILLNLLLVYKYGILGIVLATSISMFLINFLYGSKIIFDHYFIQHNVMDFYKKHLKYFMTTLLNLFITFTLLSLLPQSGIIWFGIKVIFSLLISNAIYYLVYKKTSEFKWTILLVKRIVKITGNGGGK